MLVLASILAQVSLFPSKPNYKNRKHWRFSNTRDREDFLTSAFPKLTSHRILIAQHPFNTGLGSTFWNSNQRNPGPPKQSV